MSTLKNCLNCRYAIDVRTTREGQEQAQCMLMQALYGVPGWVTQNGGDTKCGEFEPSQQAIEEESFTLDDEFEPDYDQHKMLDSSLFNARRSFTQDMELYTHDAKNGKKTYHVARLLDETYVARLTKVPGSVHTEKEFKANALIYEVLELVWKKARRYLRDEDFQYFNSRKYMDESLSRRNNLMKKVIHAKQLSEIAKHCIDFGKKEFDIAFDDLTEGDF